jgi:thiamine pyrophosphokinase
MPAEGSVVAATAVIVIGGAPVDRRALAHLPSERLVLAADSGFDEATALGLTVDIVVGDLDSITAAGLVAAEQAGITVLRHPQDKDATDTELAIDVALERGATRLVALSGGTGPDDLRLDHDLGALLALAAPRLARCEVEAWWGPAHLRVLHGPGRVELVASPGSLVSLLPVHGPAIGVTTDGLRFPLAGETLGAGTSRGISNELLARRATVSLDGGALLVVRPQALGGPP